MKNSIFIPLIFISLIFHFNAAFAESAKTALCENAIYSAFVPVGSKKVVLRASTTPPRSGYTVKLVQRPEKIIPPLYQFECTPPDGVSTFPLIPLKDEIKDVLGAKKGSVLTVYDAEGEHLVYVGTVCGGFIGTPCEDEKEYCHLESGACVTTADAQGICMPKPDICPEIYQPIIACDGKEYGNECKAHSAGHSVATPAKSAASTKIFRNHHSFTEKLKKPN